MGSVFIDVRITSQSQLLLDCLKLWLWLQNQIVVIFFQKMKNKNKKKYEISKRSNKIIAYTVFFIAQESFLLAIYEFNTI